MAANEANWEARKNKERDGAQEAADAVKQQRRHGSSKPN